MGADGPGSELFLFFTLTGSGEDKGEDRGEDNGEEDTDEDRVGVGAGLLEAGSGFGGRT